MKQKRYWSCFAFSQIRLIEGKIVLGVLLPHEANRHSLLTFHKFNKEMSIRHRGEKNCWNYVAIKRIRLLRLVK